MVSIVFNSLQKSIFWKRRWHACYIGAKLLNLLFEPRVRTIFESSSREKSGYISPINFMLEVKKSSIYGLGCFTQIPLKKRKKIALYAGELVSGMRKIEARVRAQQDRGVIKVIWMGKNVAIDAEVGGNETAYINHSCEPNAFMRSAPGNKVLFFALRDIMPGEEITIDYRDVHHPPAHACKCGASRCRSLAHSAA